MSDRVIRLDSLRFAWPGQSTLLDIETFELGRGERLFLKGPSGSGKTTLLGLIGGVHRPTAGSVKLLGIDMAGMSAARRDRFRADHTGYIFQMFNLLPYLSLLDNVALPCRFSRVRRERALIGHASLAESARSLLRGLGLEEHLMHRAVSDLSTGQQQRVAAARALIGSPELIIADEPTSALDADSREAFIALLFEQCRKSGSSVLFVSHDASLQSGFDRSLSLRELNRTSTAGAL